MCKNTSHKYYHKIKFLKELGKVEGVLWFLRKIYQWLYGSDSINKFCGTLLRAKSWPKWLPFPILIFWMKNMNEKILLSKNGAYKYFLPKIFCCHFPTNEIICTIIVVKTGYRSNNFDTEITWISQEKNVHKTTHNMLWQQCLGQN